MSGSAPDPLHLIVNLNPSDSVMLSYVLGSVVGLLRPGDTLDLTHDPSNPISSSNLATINQVAGTLQSAAPAGVILSAHSGYVPQVGALANGTTRPITAIVATLEPTGATPGLSYTFAAALSYFEETASLAHARGLLSVAYPTSAPLLGGKLQKYHWNYGQLAATSDSLWVEMQEYANQAVKDPSVWSTAITTLTAQMTGAGQPLSKLAIQIILGNTPGLLGVDPAEALADIKVAEAAGITSIDLWTEPGKESYLGPTIAGLNRSTVPPPPSQFSVSGVVHAANGSALAGAEVYANASGNSSSVVTNQTGGFAFELPNGTYTVSAIAAGWAPSGVNVTVAGAAIADLNLTLSPSNSRGPTQYVVSGQVEGSDGTALAGAQVYANASGNSSFAITNGTGAFAIELANGSYALTAVDAGWASSETNVTIMGAPLFGLTLVLAPLTFVVEGTVTNASSGAPIANATVLVVGSSPPTNATTSSSGQFVLVLAAGPQPLHISAFYYEGLNATLVVGPSNLTVAYALKPAPVFAVHGTIAGASGAAPVSNATVVLTSANGTLMLTATNGSFAAYVPNGTYQVKVIASGFVPVVVEVVVAGTDLEPLHVVLPSTATARTPAWAGNPLLVSLEIWAGAAAVSLLALPLTLGPTRGRRRPRRPQVQSISDDRLIEATATQTTSHRNRASSHPEVPRRRKAPSDRDRTLRVRIPARPLVLAPPSVREPPVRLVPDPPFEVRAEALSRESPPRVESGRNDESPFVSWARDYLGEQPPTRSERNRVDPSAPRGGEKPPT